MSGMHEMRLNKITQRWVIYSAARGKRPHDVPRHVPGGSPQGVFVADCPFCPGNERMTPPTIVQKPNGNQPWQTRVISNKYPIVHPNGASADCEWGVYRSSTGSGRHEVIVETPRHNEDVPAMRREHVLRILETYHQRVVDMAEDRSIRAVFLFRNHGVSAGTSLVHAHAQIIGTGIVPPQVQERETSALRYFAEHGRCGYCDMLAFEEREGLRVVWQNDAFLVFVPFAAEAPCETWVVPRRHAADFAAISPDELFALAEAFQETLLRLYRYARDPDYNCMIHTASSLERASAHLHWYIQIRPRIGIEAGFELGSGMAVNPSSPEEDAVLLTGIVE